MKDEKSIGCINATTPSQPRRRLSDEIPAGLFLATGDRKSTSSATVSREANRSPCGQHPSKGFIA